LEATLAALIADDTFVWPVESTDNPVLVRTGECVLVAVSVSAVVQDPALHVLLFDCDDVGDADDSTLRWVVPGPLELGAVPYVPVIFNVGVCAQMIDGEGANITIADWSDERIYVTFATNGGEAP
jgi:hypothetical protein